MAAIDRAFPYARAREVCVECAPRSATSDRLAVLREAGVTRVSLGVQQMNDDVLARNGRIHLVADVARAYAAVRAAGFPVVNLDLIAGLVGETERTFFESLDRVIDMAPDSVTIYQLEIPQNTPLFRALPSLPPAEAPAAWSEKRARVAGAFARLESAGFVVRSAYAAVRDPVRHAFVYQDAQYAGADVLGVGVSAFSCVGGVNQQNLAALDRYLAAIRAGDWPHWRGHVLSSRERAVREFILQLKLGRVDRQAFRARHGVDPADAFRLAVGEADRAGHVLISPDAVIVTRRGLLSVDRWLPAFYEPQHRGVRYS
jgi:oxygen-independent coproporphyrinogen-3 oxidase